MTVAPSAYGTFTLGRCSPPINLLTLCRILSLASFFLFCVFCYLYHGGTGLTTFEALHIIFGLLIYCALFYAIFKSLIKGLIGIYIIYELFMIILILIAGAVSIVFFTITPRKDIAEFGMNVGLTICYFIVAFLKAFLAYVFVTLYKRIVTAELSLRNSHAQYFNGQVQINAFNNEMFPAPPPDFNGTRVGGQGYDLPPQPDLTRLPTYESVMVTNKEAAPTSTRVHLN
ncbi:hypothetical protein QR680_007988 [Steinernema hermaphroditum]|uniref:Uncharacterized protein n=1 Tax=Steinernema hermaphroditum TaxID=289476 RepID=A0AA39IHB4_9BILA|nr:hypothetical protein QR680_007988 [Steinernema hermaphroditum]